MSRCLAESNAVSGVKGTRERREERKANSQAGQMLVVVETTALQLWKVLSYQLVASTAVKRGENK